MMPALLLVMTVIVVLVGDAGAEHGRRWRVGDTVTAPEWNRMTRAAGCPEAGGDSGDRMNRLTWALVECFAARLGEHEVASFARAAARGLW